MQWRVDAGAAFGSSHYVDATLTWNGEEVLGSPITFNAEAAFELRGLWELHHFKSNARTETMQIDLLDFRSGASEPALRLSTWTSQYGWRDTSPEVEEWYQSFVGDGDSFRIDLDWIPRDNLTYVFRPDPDGPDPRNPTRLIGFCAGLCNNGWDLELRKR